MIETPERLCSCGQRFIVVMIDSGTYTIFICENCDTPHFAASKMQNE